jgi:hypothetical protein
MLYIMICNLCGKEDEINRPITDNTPVLCNRNPYCPGVMENITYIRHPINLDKSCIPTRKIDNSVSYKTRK